MTPSALRALSERTTAALEAHRAYIVKHPDRVGGAGEQRLLDTYSSIKWQFEAALHGNADILIAAWELAEAVSVCGPGCGSANCEEQIYSALNRFRAAREVRP